MPNFEHVIPLLLGDPILSYSLLAALFLATVALTAGIVRLDIAALARPRAAVACALCVIASVLLSALIYGSSSPVGAAASPLLAGLERFPLLLAALAYGPTPGLLVAALYASFLAPGAMPSAAQAVLALELVLAGWLAIYPSPRQYSWAGPVNALLAYLLAWSTAGLALAQWQVGDLAVSNLLASHRLLLPGVLLATLLLLAIRPRGYALMFPSSRIGYPVVDRNVVIPPLVQRRRERERNLAQPELPMELDSRRGKRRSSRAFRRARGP